MREKIQIGFQTFVSDGQEEFGSVREISPDGRRLTVYVENAGDLRGLSTCSSSPAGPRP